MGSVSLYLGFTTKQCSRNYYKLILYRFNPQTVTLYKNEQEVTITNYHFYDIGCKILYYVNSFKVSTISNYSGLLLDISNNLVFVSINGGVSPLSAIKKELTDVKTTLIDPDTMIYDANLSGKVVAVLPTSDLAVDSNNNVLTTNPIFPSDEARTLAYKVLIDKNTLSNNFLTLIKRPSPLESLFPIVYSISGPELSVPNFNEPIIPPATYIYNGITYPGNNFDVTAGTIFSIKNITVTLTPPPTSPSIINVILFYIYANSGTNHTHVYNIGSYNWLANDGFYTMNFVPALDVVFPRTGKINFFLSAFVNPGVSYKYSLDVDVIPPP